MLINVCRPTFRSLSVLRSYVYIGFIKSNGLSRGGIEPILATGWLITSDWGVSDHSQLDHRLKIRDNHYSLLLAAVRLYCCLAWIKSDHDNRFHKCLWQYDKHRRESIACA